MYAYAVQDLTFFVLFHPARTIQALHRDTAEVYITGGLAKMSPLISSRLIPHTTDLSSSNEQVVRISTEKMIGDK